MYNLHKRDGIFLPLKKMEEIEAMVLVKLLVS